MGAILLIIFTFLELSLLVFSVLKNPEKSQWANYRLITCSAEFIIFTVLLLTPAVTLNIRFTLCFIILIFRAILAAIYFVFSKEKKEQKSIPLMGLNVAGSLLVLTVAIIPSFIFADYNGLPVTGSYIVDSTSFILVDENREDPFEGSDSHREVPVHAFYPEAHDAADEFPLVVFSHGAFGYYQSNMSAYQELASNGYVVLALDHPHHSFFTKNTAGKIVIVDPDFINTTMYINGTNAGEDEIFALTSSWVGLRTDDVNFVLDEVKKAKESGSIPANWYLGKSDISDISNVLTMTDTDKIGMFGHSLGGATSVTIGRTRDDIDAVIDLDGTMLGEELDCQNGEYTYYDEPYPVPLLSMESESHHTQADEIGVLYVNRYICSRAEDAKVIWFKGSEHMNFTDLPLFSPALSSNLGTGTIDPKSCITHINGVILNYFDYYLKGKGELTLKECYQ